MYQPKWSPKGNYFTYLCDKNKYMTLWLADKDGNNPQCICDVKNDFAQPSWGSGSVDYVWSEDESYIIFAVIR
jgi:Tol biopolymer transport system component